MNSFPLLCRISVAVALLFSLPSLQAEPAQFPGLAPAATPAPAPVPLPAKAGLEAQAAKIIIPKLQFRDATLAEAVNFLKAKARALDPAHAGLNIGIAAPAEGDAKLTLTLTEISLAEALHYVAAKVGLHVRYDAAAITITAPEEADWKRLKLPPSPESRKVEAKAQAIVFPKIELHESSVTEAIDFIQIKAAALAPDKRAINVVNLDLPLDARITAGLKDVSLYDLLHFIARLTGGELVAEPEALVLRTVSPDK